MSTDELYQAISQSVIDGEPEQAEELAHKALNLGLDPLEVIDHGYTRGMNVLGDSFARGEVFLPHLVMGGEAMKAAIAVLEPELARRQQQRKVLGKVVIGTVAGDIHEIGKSLVATMLSANGFQVFDLGVDVPVSIFVEKAREVEADIVGLSALLTTTMLNQRRVIEELQEAGLREKVKVIVGGAPVSQSWADQIGADGYSENAIGAVALAKELMGRGSIVNETGLTQQLAFVMAQRHEDEATVLAQAVREGIHTLYREVLIEAYLLGRVSRETVLKELGPEQLEEIEYQRDALQRDVAWGMEHA